MINQLKGMNKLVLLITMIAIVLAGVTASTTAERELSKIIFYVG